MAATLAAPVDETLAPIFRADAAREDKLTRVRYVEDSGDQPKPPKGPKRLEVPAELPGAGAPRVTLPPTTAPPKEREAALNNLSMVEQSGFVLVAFAVSGCSK